MQSWQIRIRFFKIYNVNAMKYFFCLSLVILRFSSVSAQTATANPFAIDTSYQRIGVIDNLPQFYIKAKEHLVFPQSWLSGSFSDFNSWRNETREKVKTLFLTQPPECDFNPQVIDTEDRGSYTAKKVVFNLNACSRVLGYLLVPKGKGTFPAVLLLHDHGAKFDIGKEKMIRPFHVAAEIMDSAEKWTTPGYGGRFVGDELAKRGYVCFATDALNWGDRGGAGKEGQQALASNLLNMGMSLAGLVAWEDLATVRFVSSMPEVDNTRIAAMGHSFGSYRAWQLAALSDQIRAAVCVCWMAGRNELLVPGNNLTKGQSSYTTTHPGLANLLDYPDVAALACPKPMLFFNGESDHLFPRAAVEPAFAKMQAIWASQQAADKLVTKFWPGGHQFSMEMQEEAFRWLDEQFILQKD